MHEPMRILVTGAGGQVGLDLIDRLRTQGHDVHGSDIAPRPTSNTLTQNVPWHPLDVTDSDRVREAIGDLRPHRIFHLVAILSARGEEMPQKTYRVNQDGTFNVLEAAREFEVGQVMYTSTIAVFGPGLPGRVGDDVPLHPTTMYGVSKVAGELLGEYYARRFQVDFRGVRFPGLISASLPGGGTSDYALYMYVDGVLKGRYEAFCAPRPQIPLMYMPDAIRALVELSEVSRNDLSRCVYNIAAFSPTAQELADSVTRLLPDAKITFKSDPHRQAVLDSWPHVLDDTLARSDWGWQPTFDVDAMSEHLLPRIRELVQNNPDALG